MNDLTKKLTAIGLCSALCLGSAGIAFAQTADAPAKTAEPAVEEAIAATPSTGEITKDETVYVLTAANGTVEKVIVSDWLQNPQSLDTIADTSLLTDPENVKGDEGYTADGETGLLWDAQGNDLYYQGESQQELPVTMTVSYWLDGQSISAEELAGKSGQVTIRFDYENHQYETVEIAGQQERIYVPFAMLTGLMLDTDTFCNVQVSNGKLLNDGDRTVVIGLAFPGLQEDLALDREQLELPDYVEITADVTDFTLGMTVTVATNSLFNTLEDGELDTDGDLTGMLTALTDAMTQLTDGSSALYDGLCTLLEQSRTLADGVDQLSGGAASLKSGLDSLQAGASQLQTGLDTLSASSATLNTGAGQVFDTLLSTATAQLQATGASVPALTAENYAAVLDGVLAKLGDSTGATYQTVAALKTSLDSYNSFYQGLLTYTAGVDSAAQGAASMQAGASQLQSGAATLYQGTMRLQSSMPALLSGITQLRDGSMTLNDGLQQLREQSTDRLAAMLGSDPATTLARLQATCEVSRAYQNFSGLADGMTGQVKFLYRTAEIQCD